MKHSIHIRAALAVTMIVSVADADAQATFNHDAAKMNQITVQETGTGNLTPEYYYTVFHKSYRNSAGEKNKLAYRTLTGLSAYPQVEDADSVEEAMKTRAAVEALNVADQQIDIAWAVERSKIEDKLSDFQRNINRIIAAGGSGTDKKRWEEYYNIYQCAVKATQDAYMPNSMRKKEYLAIYNDVSKQNEALVSYIVMLSRRSKTEELLSATCVRNTDKAAAAAAAHNRWRSAGWSASGQSGTDGSEAQPEGAEQTVQESN